METIHDFMLRFFAARTRQIERDIENRKDFRQSYFAFDCSWDDRSGIAKQSTRENILNIVENGDEGIVVTHGTEPWPKLRYWLKASMGAWQITMVEGQCILCQGVPGHADCLCDGTGWRTPENIRKKAGERKRMKEGGNSLFRGF